MLDLKKLLKSNNGKLLISILLGLGISGLFKMSCDNRECIVHKGPQFTEENKVIKYNNKCYKVDEKMESCGVKDDRKMIMI